VTGAHRKLQSAAAGLYLPLTFRARIEGMRAVATIVGLFALLAYDLAFNGGHQFWAAMTIANHFMWQVGLL